jgi:uncharacterized alkaline shock family protein YloU
MTMAATTDPAGLRDRPGIVSGLARAAAASVPGVVRVGSQGPRLLAALRGAPVATWWQHGQVHVHVRVVAAPGRPLGPLALRVREAVAAAVREQMGLELGEVSVLVDGLGG